MPPLDSWSTHTFRFLQPDGTIRSWTSPGVIDTEAIGYRYDTITAPPLHPPRPTPARRGDRPLRDRRPPVPEPIAEALQLKLDSTVDIALARPGALTAGSVTASRWLLRFAGVRSQLPATTSFKVYLGPSAAPGDDDDVDDEDLVGLLSLFGAFEATTDDDIPGNGVSRILDVTSRMAELGATTELDGLPVRLVALNPDRDLAHAGVTVERLTLEFG